MKKLNTTIEEEFLFVFGKVSTGFKNLFNKMRQGHMNVIYHTLEGNHKVENVVEQFDNLLKIQSSSPPEILSTKFLEFAKSFESLFDHKNDVHFCIGSPSYGSTMCGEVVSVLYGGDYSNCLEWAKRLQNKYHPSSKLSLKKRLRNFFWTISKKERKDEKEIT